MKKDFKKISFVLITLFLLSTLAIVSINSFNTEYSEHGTLILEGADNPTDATKSNFVKKYLDWLQNFTGKRLSVDKNGKVSVVSKPPTENYMARIVDEIISMNITVKIKLVNGSATIWFDAFGGKGTQTQDIDDLGMIPDPDPKNPDPWDKAEQIAHTLNEGFYAAWLQAGYMDSHRKGGIVSENSVRGEQNATGTRVMDGHTWQKNATHRSKHWFGPPDPQGNKKEVYREEFDVNKTTGKIIKITRTKNPPNPKTVKDPVSGEVLVFIGRIVEVGSPNWDVWSGEIENFQSVTYEILKIIQGSYTEANILIYHAIILGSPDADPETPQLSSSIFYPGNVVIVKAVFNGVAWETDTSVVGGFATTTTVTSTTTVITSTTITTPITATITSPTTIISTATFTTTITFTTPSIDMSSLFPYIVLVFVLAIVAVGVAIYFMRLKRKT